MGDITGVDTAFQRLILMPFQSHLDLCIEMHAHLILAEILLAVCVC